MVYPSATILSKMAMKNEEFKKSSFHVVETKMIFFGDGTVIRNATNYLSWSKNVYGDKWTEHIGNLVYGEVDGEMIIYVPDKDGNILAR